MFFQYFVYFRISTNVCQCHVRTEVYALTELEDMNASVPLDSLENTVNYRSAMEPAVLLMPLALKLLQVRNVSANQDSQVFMLNNYYSKK